MGSRDEETRRFQARRVETELNLYTPPTVARAQRRVAERVARSHRDLHGHPRRVVAVHVAFESKGFETRISHLRFKG